MSEQDADMWRLEFERVQTELTNAQLTYNQRVSELERNQLNLDNEIMELHVSRQDAETWRFNLNVYKLNLPTLNQPTTQNPANSPPFRLSTMRRLVKPRFPSKKPRTGVINSNRSKVTLNF